MLICVLFLEFLRPFCSLSLCMHNLFSPKIEFLVALPWLLLVVIQAPKLKYHLNEISESFVSAVFIEMTLLIRSLTNFDKLAVHKNVLLTLWLSLRLLNRPCSYFLAAQPLPWQLSACWSTLFLSLYFKQSSCYFCILQHCLNNILLSDVLCSGRYLNNLSKFSSKKRYDAKTIKCCYKESFGTL